MSGSVAFAIGGSGTFVGHVCRLLAAEEGCAVVFGPRPGIAAELTPEA